MSRSPLSYPLNRGMDMDAGGAGDLQTDVMRFMAIIALCLVAIFALVQSLPAPDPRSPAPEPRAPAASPPQAAEPAIVKAAPEPPPAPAVEKPRPKPAAPPARLRLPPAAAYSEPDTPTMAPLEQPRPAAQAPAKARPTPAAAPPAAVGFTLRFESDLALTRLVARDEIGLYAIRPGQTLRMSAGRGNVSFWPASSPGQFHEMDESTVPASVVAALRRRGHARDVKWGVTLPARLSRDLDRYLAEHSGGSLVIGANGSLRLER